MIHILDKNYFRYYGRIIEKENSATLGFTNSSIEFYVRGNGKDDKSASMQITATIASDTKNQPNYARLKVYIDDKPASPEPFSLDKPCDTYTVATICDNKVHKISIVKITEALFSYARFLNIQVENGDILPLPYETDTRAKVEFIGDSITCGYGVLGSPNSEFDINEEDGELSYAAIVAKELNLNARYTSVSGYGMYCEYTGNLKGTLPYIYPYTNYFVDPETLYNYQEFIPELVVVNLGTNDCDFLSQTEIQEKFITCYQDFLKLIRSQYPDTKLLCVCGTLRHEAFPFIQKACDILKKQGFQDIYTLELPYHNVKENGQASNHPSPVTHQKDAKRIIQKIKEFMPNL